MCHLERIARYNKTSSDVNSSLAPTAGTELVGENATESQEKDGANKNNPIEYGSYPALVREQLGLAQNSVLACNTDTIAAPSPAK